MSDEAVELVEEAFKRNSDGTTNRREAFRLFYQNYRQVYDDANEDNRFTNNYFDPLTFETVATYRPFICSRPPALRMRPREENDRLAANRLREWQDYQWYVQKMREKRQRLSWYTAVFGTGCLYHFYHKETKKQKYKAFGNKVSWQEREVNVFDDPDCEVIDIVNDFFPDDFGTTVDTCRNIIHRQWLHVDEIKRLSEGKDPWLTDGASAQELIDTVLSSDYNEKKNEWNRYNDTNFKQLSDLGIVELLNYWEDDRVIVLANRTFVLRDTPNPYHFKKKPYTVFVDEDNPAELWGLGEGEILVKLQHILNTVGRMHIDAAKRQLRQKMIAPRGSGLDPGALYDEDEHVAEAAFTQGVIPLEPPVMANAGLPTMMQIREAADRASGFTPLFKGMSNSGADTATEKRLEQGNMMARAFYKLGQFDQAFANWMMMNVGLALQYYPEEKFYRVIGRDGVQFKTLQYNDLLAGIDVEIESRSGQPISIDEKTLQADSMLATYSQNPYIRQDELTKRTLEMKEIPEFERLLKSPEELQAEMQDQQQAMQQQNEDAYSKQLTTEILRSALSDQEGADEGVGR